jgi:hypothetical protein
MVFIFTGSLLYVTLAVVIGTKCYRKRRNFYNGVVDLIYGNEYRIGELEENMRKKNSEIKKLKEFKVQTNKKIRNRFKTLKRKINQVEKGLRKELKKKMNDGAIFENTQFNLPEINIAEPIYDTPNSECKSSQEFPKEYIEPLELDPTAFTWTPNDDNLWTQSNDNLFRFNFEPSELNNELFVQGTSIEQQLSEGEEKEEEVE